MGLGFPSLYTLVARLSKSPLLIANKARGCQAPVRLQSLPGCWSMAQLIVVLARLHNPSFKVSMLVLVEAPCGEAGPCVLHDMTTQVVRRPSSEVPNPKRQMHLMHLHWHMQTSRCARQIPHGTLRVFRQTIGSSQVHFLSDEARAAHVPMARAASRAASEVGACQCSSVEATI